ncbi:hypothetical protein Q8F55_000038 [Vanrija albida]|uniref:F-box domain-containing protein n=1 Tax=Vanrija albida TaxID=181172 RepID=A0ABR3QC49_9TREE
MPALDHTAYPTLIGGILAAADVRTLVAFSSTSRTYRARIAADLLHHAVLHAEDGHLSLRVPGTSSPLPHIPSLVRVLDLDGDSWGPAPPPAPGLTTLPRPMHNALTSLRAVRRRGTAMQDINDPYKFDGVPLLVDFLDLDSNVQVAGTHPDLDLGLSAETHVLHLRWCDDEPLDDDDGRLIHDTEFLFQAHRDFEYVLIVGGYTSSGAPAGLGSALEVLRLVLSGLAESGLRPAETEMRITIVGLESTDMVLPHPVAMEGPDDVPALLRPAAAFLEDAVGSIHDYEYEEPSSVTWRRTVRYGTLDEWRESLGEEDRPLVGVWA